MSRLLPCLLVLICIVICAGCDGAASSSAAGTEDLTSQEAPADSGAPSGPEASPEDGPPADEAPQEEPYVRVIDPAGPMVALTFDDGPHPVYTDRLLDILEEHHAVATFFEVGVNAARHPEPIARAAALGCEIGSHSNAHKDLSKLKTAALLEDLETADQAIAAAAGRAPSLLRPPYGAVNSAVKHDTGRSVITWTVDTQDWLTKDAGAIIQLFQELGDLDGEIVLLHSTYETTAEAMETVIPWLIQEGYQLVTVSELMAYYYGELPQAGQFYGYTYFTTHGRTDTPLQLPAEGEASPEEPAPSDPQQPPAVPAEEPDTVQPAAPPEETDTVQPGPAAEPDPPAEPAAPALQPDPPQGETEDPSQEETGAPPQEGAEDPSLPGQDTPAEEPPVELPPAETDPDAPAPGAELPPQEGEPLPPEDPEDTEPPAWL